MENFRGLKVILILAVTAFLFFRPAAKAPQETAEAFPSNYQHTLIPGLNGKYAMLGKASWYSRHSPGINIRTANNETFNDKDMTCAIWGPAFNSHVKVTNIRNGRSVILRVNDRGPHGRFFRQGRIIDLTKAAFQKLSDSKKGLIEVKVEFL